MADSTLRLLEVNFKNSFNLKDELFVFSNGKNLTKYNLGKKLKELDPNALPHGLRKGGAQDAIQSGVPLPTIMAQADWRSVDTLNAYNLNTSKSAQIKTFKRFKKNRGLG